MRVFAASELGSSVLVLWRDTPKPSPVWVPQRAVRVGQTLEVTGRFGSPVTPDAPYYVDRVVRVKRRPWLRLPGKARRARLAGRSVAARPSAEQPGD